jgi:hypothetical protein
MICFGGSADLGFLLQSSRFGGVWLEESKGESFLQGQQWCASSREMNKFGGGRRGGRVYSPTIQPLSPLAAYPRGPGLPWSSRAQRPRDPPHQRRCHLMPRRSGGAGAWRPGPSREVDSSNLEARAYWGPDSRPLQRRGSQYPRALGVQSPEVRGVHWQSH